MPTTLYLELRKRVTFDVLWWKPLELKNLSGNLYSLKALRQPGQKFWPKILTLYSFYCNFYLHFLRPRYENIFNIVCIVSEKSEK